MATGIVPQGQGSVVFVHLPGNGTIELTMYGNGCAYFAMRGTGVRECAMFTVWDSSPWYFGDGATNTLNITKDSRTITITNPGGGGAAMFVFGAYVSQYPS